MFTPRTQSKSGRTLEGSILEGSIPEVTGSWCALGCSTLPAGLRQPTHLVDSERPAYPIHRLVARQHQEMDF